MVMQSLFAAIALLVGVSNAAPTCKAVEWTSISGTYSLTTTFPIDVCYSGSTSATDGQGTTYSYAYSYWWYCTANGDVWIATYSTEDCSGLPSTQTAADLSALTYYSSYTAYCSLPACDYVTLSTSAAGTTDCSNPGASTFSVYSSTPMISGYCNQLTSSASYSYTCSAGNALYNIYSTADCSGDATSYTYDLSADVSCDQSTVGTSYSAAVQLECGSAHFAGLLNEQNSDGSNPVASHAYRVFGVYAFALAVLAAFYQSS
eukprot:CAMPEP_0197054564 /NCGR_PEP_ID=MMETSP1384-20130603/44290_1 /TAXON_ID=29189 /ORGANISM="Ammonia sp." /LENGTH=260 /DNA_ID=CAMNT_0042487787 /DNA_START=30 /DNA_END=812 /DNA_ORIENTATION=+